MSEVMSVYGYLWVFLSVCMCDYVYMSVYECLAVSWGFMGIYECL